MQCIVDAFPFPIPGVLAIVIAPERATGRAESRNGLLLYAEMEYQ